MVDITSKKNTLRIAKAQAIVNVSRKQTIDAIHNNQVPKGNVFEMSKAAGLLGVKKTPELLPDCHPLPIEFTGVEYKIKGLSIFIEVTVKTIYKTGVEVEAMHGASIIALNMYDMLKPIDKGIEISNIKLLSKSGGKSSYPLEFDNTLDAQIIICSDSVSKGIAEDSTGEKVKEFLKSYSIENNIEIISDEENEIIDSLKNALSKNSNLVIFSGGTGVSKRDITSETIIPMLTKRLTGVEQEIQSYGQQKTPFAMLSRTVVGTINESLVICLPGSPKGAIESLEAVFPHVLHTLKVIDGKRHE